MTAPKRQSGGLLWQIRIDGKGLGPDPEKTEDDHNHITVVGVAITQENLTGAEQGENSAVS